MEPKVPSKQQYLESVRGFVDSTTKEHATTSEQEYCFDSIVGEGDTRIAIKVSLTIDNVSTHTRDELSKICLFLRCSPLIVGERTRKSHLEDGVIHTRGSIPAITLETLRMILEEQKFPTVITKKGGKYVLVNGESLKAAREESNLSRGDVAEELGLSRRAIYEYERGTISPTKDVAIRLEELLDVQLIEPLNPLQTPIAKNLADLRNEGRTVRTNLARKTLEMFSRLGLFSTLTEETPFDMLTSLRRHVLLSYLTRRLERLDEERLRFLAKLAEVLDEEPAIIASDPPTFDNINGIPVIYLKELLAVQDSKEFIALIHNRRGA
ncbi:MAG: helix-turn-helix domain-containing protein [Candidatus Hermodarchaeota archaeon]|nr:helix-turn-helix domain-containing protein [Candidatus Hermodarchaeota archaeon]